MRTSLMVLVVAATLGLTAACGSSGSDDAAETTTTTAAPAASTTTTSTTEPGVAVDGWATTVCASFDRWLSGIREASEAVGEGVAVDDVASAQAAVAEVYATMSSATRTLIDEIEAAGAPALAEGDDLQADLVEKFEAVEESARDAQREIEALEVDDADAFEAQRVQLGDDFQAEVQKVTDSLDDLDQKYPSQELDAALSSACTF